MPGPEPMTINLTWDTTSLTMPVGGTASTTVSNSITNYMQYLTSSDIDALTSSVATSSVDGTTHTVTFTGVAAGTVTIPANTTIQSPQSVVSTNALTITVVDATPKYLDKDGLDYYDSLIATEIDGKQDTLTAGSGISISNNVISATGGGVADSVAWGHITGTMADQTDLTTALGAKANSADLATVATSGDYDDLTDKPTIGNATLTIQKNGTSAGTFTANATSNKTINITVPTTAADVSALPASTKYGASIAVSINTTDYKVTTTLKDQDGNTLGTAQTIDLPLESVVVNGSYDSTNKKIVLTLQSGSTIDIPVADLVAGLQSEITSTNKLASDLVDDTGQTHKFMTSAEKTKLSGIATGAEVNVQSDWNVTSTSSDAFIKNKPTIPTKTSQLTNDSGFLTSYTETDPVYSASPAAGITSTDITNWNNKSDFSGSYNDLTNKPTIPTVNNATLTIQKNGTNVQTFTANASANVTANITVPTNTSDLNNDSDFITSADTGWKYLGEQSLSANSDTLTYTLPAQYDNYKVVFYGAMASTASDGCWIDFIMYNGSNAISVVHQVQLVAGTTWSSAFNGGTFAMNIQSNPYAGLLFKFESWRAGANDWRHYTGSMASNAGGSATTRTSIVNGRATSATQPTAFAVKTYGTGNVFNTGATIRVWASNNDR